MLGVVTSFRFLSNHGLILLSITDDPHVRMRDIADHLSRVAESIDNTRNC